MASERVIWVRRGEARGEGSVNVDHVLDGLAELADEALQREQWAAGPASPTEAFERAFGDSALSLVLDRPDAAELLGPNLAAAFETLLQHVRAVDLDRSIDEVLDDPSMTLVRTAASRAATLVREQISE